VPRGEVIEMTDNIIEQVAETWNDGNLALADEFLAEDFVGHLMEDGRELTGPEGYKQWVKETHELFPDLELTFDPVFATDDVLCGRWRFTGTHRGAMPEYGIEPTGNSVEFSGLFIDRVEDGRVVEMWHLMDNLTLMQQLGVIPQEAAGTA
jgi:steroid delta-isomerase-like uncharacterized protein